MMATGTATAKIDPMMMPACKALYSASAIDVVENVFFKSQEILAHFKISFFKKLIGNKKHCLQIVWET